MADTEEPQFTTLAERIAALNTKQKGFSKNASVTTKKPPPPPPPTVRNPTFDSVRSASPPKISVAPLQSPSLPPRPNRSKPPPVPRNDSSTSVRQADGTDARPPLPSRTSTSTSISLQSPALPPRRGSGQPNGYLSARRNSASSEMSQSSAMSALSLTQTASSVTSQGSNGASQRNLPPLSDMANLPPLPPTRREREAQAQRESAQPGSTRQSQNTQTQRPGLPPRLPSRLKQDTTDTSRRQTESVKPLRALPSSEKPPMRVLGFGTGHKEQQPTNLTSTRDNSSPPPVPLSSRPTADEIAAVSTRATGSVPQQKECWICRDWSGPDNKAAQFPRQSLPRNDPIGYLASNLCSSFPSYTDKARAIFTWFHHNIMYDTDAFFNNRVKHQTPEQTISGGWAVCQGYADTYQAIACRAGLECVVVCGHGKGYGHTALKKGERPPPPKPDGHAWNAVRIDGGDWKLLDACWGAGHICGTANLYKQEFSPKQFTMTNDEFGNSHFPENAKYQFRNDGRTMNWDEYFVGRVLGEPVTFYTNAHQEGIKEESVEPRQRHIEVNSGKVIRFQFSKICEHWTSEKDGQGKPPLLLLSIHGMDGRKDDMIPIQTDGYWHWVDVNARDLGAAGQQVKVIQVTSVNKQDARGISEKEFFAKKGRCATSWAGVIGWDLV